MKTDLEKFQELYASLGIILVVVPTADENGVNMQRVEISEGGYPDEGQTLSSKFDGYGGFYSSIEFDMDGKFIKQGFWE